MTIEPQPAASLVLQKAGKTGLWLGGLLLAWLITMATVMLLFEPAPAALVIAPDIQRLGPLSDDIRFIRGGDRVLVLTSDEPGYVKDLYQAGAWLVLPALRNGCLDPKVVTGSWWES